MHSRDVIKQESRVPYTDSVPLFGHMIVEAIKEDALDYKRKQLGMSEDSPIQISAGRHVLNAETGELEFKLDNFVTVPLTKGRIVAMAEDCYGEWFQRKYGKDRRLYPQIGDIVTFLPNQTFKKDPAGNYHLIADDDVYEIITKRS